MNGLCTRKSYLRLTQIHSGEPIVNFLIKEYSVMVKFQLSLNHVNDKRKWTMSGLVRVWVATLQ